MSKIGSDKYKKELTFILFFGKYLTEHMIEEIIKEKTSADHLLYVSLKYTKTCDVMLNLIARWKSLIELCFDAILQNGVEKKKVPNVPNSPKQRVEFVKTYFKKSEAIKAIVPLYIFFKKIPELPKTREGEFRKNVNLKIMEPEKTTEINMERLMGYAGVVEKFISESRAILKG